MDACDDRLCYCFPIVTLLDTETGRNEVVTDVNLWNWWLGTWSHDANRSMYFGLEDKYEDDYFTDNDCQRFLVINAELPEWCDLSIRDLNKDYPDALLAEFLSE